MAYFLINHGLQALRVHSKRPSSCSPLIDANDFDVLAYPIQRQVDPAAVSGIFDFLFDHLLPGNPELGLGGFARIFRLPADLFQAYNILLKLAEHVDFLSARILRNSRLELAEFPMTGEKLC